MMRPTGRAPTSGALDADDIGGLAERAAAVNRAFSAMLPSWRRICA